MDQEGIDAGSPRRPECVAQNLTRLFEVDISHHIEGAVEIAVADRRDDDISNLAMVDARNLSWGLQSHPGDTLGGLWVVARVEQASTVLSNSPTQSATRSGVCTDI